MSIYKLYATGTTGADDLAALDIQFQGLITAWYVFGWASGLSADNDTCQGEISFLSASTFTSNDARGTIAMFGISQAFITSGMANQSVSTGLSNLAIPVSAGERIHMHIGTNGTVGTFKFNGILYVEDTADANLRRRR